MLTMIKTIISALVIKESTLVDTHPEYYTLYFYHVRNSKLSTKRTRSTWYATVPSTWVGKPLVRTSMRIDRRMYDSNTSIMGHSVTFHGTEHKHMVRTAKEVR